MGTSCRVRPRLSFEWHVIALRLPHKAGLYLRLLQDCMHHMGPCGRGVFDTVAKETVVVCFCHVAAAIACDSIYIVRTCAYVRIASSII